MPWLQIVITVVLTSLIVWAFAWIEKNKKTHPDVYKNKGTIRFIVWLFLNIGQF